MLDEPVIVSQDATVLRQQVEILERALRRIHVETIDSESAEQAQQALWLARRAGLGQAASP